MDNKKALLFINGDAPKTLPVTERYDIVACSDGAFHYLKSMNFPLHKLDFISGDFDSHSGADESLYAEKFIHTPDQDKTDFGKSLEILIEKGAKTVDVFGGSGGEMDHFLGNLTVAYSFKEKIEIKFFDEFSTYYFIPKDFILKDVKGKLISLYPFPVAENVVTSGLNWPLNSETLKITDRIGTRNFAVDDEIRISYQSGDLLIFVGGNYL